MTFGDWSEKWWRWLISIPRPRNPAFDTTGRFASDFQRDQNMFFLCQTVEGLIAPPHRQTTVPSDRSIFMPIINWLSAMGVDGDSESELVRVAKEKMDIISGLLVEVNGKSVDIEPVRYRARSRLFIAELPKGNILNLPPEPRAFVSDGYWICFHPIKEKTRISTFGSCSSGITKIGVEDQLEVG